MTKISEFIWRGRCARLALSLFLPFALSLMACSEKTPPSKPASDDTRQPLPTPPPEGAPSEQRYQYLASRFAQILINRDYAQAYAMASSHLKARMDEATFAAAHQDARDKNGYPVRYEIGILSIDPSQLAGPEFKSPDGIPADARRAWISIKLILKLDESEKVAECYLLRILLVEEAGQEKIAHFEYAPCEKPK